MKGIKFEEVGKSAIVQQLSIDNGPNAEGIQIAAGPFNSRGVVTDPAFVMSRPVGQDDQIEFSIKAHPVAHSKWIAEPSWHSNAGHTPGHCQQPSSQSAVFQTRSEAVEDAINRGIRQIIGEFGGLVDTPDWKRRLKSLRAWAATAMEQVRAADETLPLRGVSVIDLACGGLGGFGMGLSSLGAHVTLACDIDDRARDVYQQNVHPERMHGDLCSLDGKGLSCDILTMGLMCQAFSRAGNALGMNDPNLADAYKHSMRLLTEIDAKVVVIECVRQLLSINEGMDAEVVRQTLLDAGYQVQHRTLNTKGFGLPQNRERAFFVATRIGLSADELIGYVFPSEQAPSAVVADIMDNHVAGDVGPSRISVIRAEPTTRQNRMVEVGRIDNRNSQGYRIYSPLGLGATLTASSGGRGQTAVYWVNGDARGLTPREACRMQGLPEWAEHHEIDKQACKHAGNAVGIPLVRALVRSLAVTLGTAPDSAFGSFTEGGAA